MDYTNPIKLRLDTLARMSSWVQHQNYLWRTSTDRPKALLTDEFGDTHYGYPAGPAPTVAKFMSRMFDVLEMQSSKPLNTAQRDFWAAEQGVQYTETVVGKGGSKHRAEYRDTGKSEVTISWHWPRGTFDRRMSALEIATFILPHMPSIAGLLTRWPDVHVEFMVLLQRLVLWPMQVLDDVLPWIQRVDYNEADEILLLDLRAKPQTVKTPQAFSLPSAI